MSQMRGRLSQLFGINRAGWNTVFLRRFLPRVVTVLSMNSPNESIFNDVFLAISNTTAAVCLNEVCLLARFSSPFLSLQQTIRCLVEIDVGSKLIFFCYSLQTKDVGWQNHSISVGQKFTWQHALEGLHIPEFCLETVGLDRLVLVTNCSSLSPSITSQSNGCAEFACS